MSLTEPSIFGFNIGFWYIGFPFLIFILMQGVYKIYRRSEEKRKENLLRINDQEFDILEKIINRNDKRTLFKYICKVIKDENK